MNSKIKVLHIMSSFGGGISSFIRNKAKSVNSSKIIFDIVTFNDFPKNFENEINEMGGNIYRIPNPKKEGIINYKNQYQTILKENGPYHMIHCHVGGHRAFSFYLLSKQLGIERFVVHAHSSEPYYFNGKPLKKKIESKIDCFLNQKISKEKLSCGRNASLFYFGKKALEEGTIMHIPNSIDINNYTIQASENQIDYKKKLGIPLDKWIIGHVGRLDENKNHSLLIELAKRMKEDSLPYYWLFIGGGKLLEEIKQTVIDENLEDYIGVLGRREDVNLLYPLMDVFTLPSYSEGLPTVCIEAQASRTPCVVSDTITREIDMGLGMVDFVSINKPQDWLLTLQDAVQKSLPSYDIIKQTIINKNFSNETSAKLYEDFVMGYMKNYTL